MTQDGQNKNPEAFEFIAPDVDVDMYTEVLDKMGSIVSTVYPSLTETIPSSDEKAVKKALRSPTPGRMNSAARLFSNKPTKFGGKGSLTLDGGYTPSPTYDEMVRKSLFTGLEQAVAIDKIKIDYLGADSETDASNSLIANVVGAAGIQAGMLFPGDEGELQALDMFLVGLASSAAKSDNRQIPWYSVKILQYRAGLIAGASLKSLAEGQSKEMGLQEIEKVTTQNDELLRAALEARSYGLKPAIAPSLLGTGDTDEWEIQQPKYFYEGMQGESADQLRRHPHAMYNISNGLASFMGTTGQYVSDRKIAMKFDTENEGVTNTKLFASDTTPGARSTLAIILTRDGDLRMANSLISLGEYAKEAGLEEAYQALRSELISLFADLVVPTYITDQFEKTEKAIFPKNSDRQEHDPKSFTGLRRLVLARTKTLLRSKEDINDEDGGSEDPDIIHRTASEKVRHGVIGHIRKLRGHMRASQFQRAECEEDLGITLAEHGETYVREHFRGSEENEGAGHKVVYAAGSMATKKAAQQKR